jgi:hypothetical protein
MAPENPFVAKARLQSLRRYLPVSQNFLDENERDFIPERFLFNEVPTYRPIQRLSENFAESLRMMSEIQKIRAELPGIDCGACGAPSCRAFAEDIVRGNAVREGCMVERVRQIEENNKSEQEEDQ